MNLLLTHNLHLNFARPRFAGKIGTVKCSHYAGKCAIFDSSYIEDNQSGYFGGNPDEFESFSESPC